MAHDSNSESDHRTCSYWVPPKSTRCPTIRAVIQCDMTWKGTVFMSRCSQQPPALEEDHSGVGTNCSNRLPKTRTSSQWNCRWNTSSRGSALCALWNV